VDWQGYFTSVDVGLPGCIGDAGAWLRSDIKAAIDNGTLLPNSHMKVVGGEALRPYLLGDAAFRFEPTMMKLYGGTPGSGTYQGVFNWLHVRCRRQVEQSFGRLINRFQICKAKRVSPVWFRRVVLACCILHNICQASQDEYRQEEWETAPVPAPPPRDARVLQAAAALANRRTRASTRAERIRDRLAVRAQRLKQEGRLPK
jgi:hypothetical protein